MRKILSAFVISFIILFVFTVRSSFAASTTIGFSPKTGSFGKPFTVDLVIDGHGDKFNAAEATVTPSSSLAIKDLSLGDCNFSFIKTPSEQNPSFAGVILSTYDTKCSVYTLTLVPVAIGNATIMFSKPTVRRYGDAINVFTSSSNASYDLTAALEHPSVPVTQSSSLYTLSLRILSSTYIPDPRATVILNEVTSKNKHEKAADSSGMVQFTNLQKGVYDAVITENNNKVGENIINVSGTNHVLALSINLAAQKNNPLLKNTQSFFTAIENNPLLLIGALIFGIIIGVGIALLVIKLIGRKKRA